MARPSLLDETVSVLARLSSRVREAAERTLDRIEDPEEARATGRRRLLERLARLRQAVAAVASLDRALSTQLAMLQQRASRQRTAGLAAERRRLDDDLDALVNRCRPLAERVERWASDAAAGGEGAAAGSDRLASAGEHQGSSPASWRRELDALGGEIAGAEAAARARERRFRTARERALEIARSLSAEPAATGRRNADLDEELARTRRAASVEEELRRLKDDLRRRSR